MLKTMLGLFRDLLALGCVLLFKRVYARRVCFQYASVCSNWLLAKFDEVTKLKSHCVHFPLGGAEGPEKCQAGL